MDAKIAPYIHSIKKVSTTLIENSKIPYTHLDQKMHNILKKLSNNKNIAIKPADRNLGTVIIVTKDYINMCLAHLIDIETYEVIHDYHPTNIYNKLIQIMKQYNQYTRPHSNIKSILAAS